MKFHYLLVGALCVWGCGARETARVSPKPVVPKPDVADWKRVVTSADLDRLRKWRDAFVTGLAEARADGNGALIAREGALLVPDAGMDVVALPSGRYRCRIIKLGAKGAGMASYTPYPAFDCLVSDEGGVASFSKLTGSQRPVGFIFDDSAARKIFLGTLMLGDETSALEYGRDAKRDLAGALQRVGDKRWRLILPYPRFESVLDVVELVPAA